MKTYYFRRLSANYERSNVRLCMDFADENLKVTDIICFPGNNKAVIVHPPIIVRIKLFYNRVISWLKRKKSLPYVKGDFYWEDGVVGGKAGFKRNDINGKFNLAKIPDSNE